MLLFERLAQAREGEFEAKATVDGVDRLYHYQQVGTLPLVQSVAMSIDDIYQDWWRKTIWITSILGLCGAIMALLCFGLYRELRRRAEAEAALVTLSEEDKLTGLANRRKFDQALAAEWQRAARLGGWLSLVMIDVDHFKAYNDSFGHPAGDGALAALAHCLARWAHRAGDVTARYGGEEFAVILPHMTAAEAMRLAEIIRHDVLRLKLDHPRSSWRMLSISIGVASARPLPKSYAGALIAEADLALYASKAAGRNCSTLYTPDLSKGAALDTPIDGPQRTGT